MSHWAEYDYVVVNTDIDHAFAEVRAILAPSGSSASGRPACRDFVRRLQAEL